MYSCSNISPTHSVQCSVYRTAAGDSGIFRFSGWTAGSRDSGLKAVGNRPQRDRPEGVRRRVAHWKFSIGIPPLENTIRRNQRDR